MRPEISHSPLQRAARLLSRLLLGLILLSPGVVHAAEATDAADATTSAEAAPEPPQALRSPRATMETFLHAMNDFKRKEREDILPAIETLDLSGINALVRPEQGQDLAWMLLEVLDRTEIVNTRRLPDDPDTPQPYQFKRYPEGVVSLSKADDGRWLFSSKTIAALPKILDGLTGKQALRIKDDDSGASRLPWHLKIRSRLPEPLRARLFLLENWQWLGILAFILAGVIIDRLFALLARGFIHAWNHSKHWRGYQRLPDDMLRPLGIMAMAGIWWYGANHLALEVNYRLVLLVAAKFLASIAAVWSAYRLVDLAGAWLHRQAHRTESKLDDALVPMATKSLKIFVTIAGLLFIAGNLNIDLTGLIAGLGLGGLAFALAAKDMVQNLFGSITILTDRTFLVGDWIIVGDVEGTVENIGFRSTRIRTFYNSLITVPNSQFITAEVDNMGQRRYRRMKCDLGLTYETPPEKIEAFCEGIRELVRLHPYMRKDYYHIYLNQLGSSSLDVLVYVFWEAPDWGTELRERHRFLLDILRLGKRLGIEFAYPTQTVYLRPDEGTAPEAPATAGSPEEGRHHARAIVEGHLGVGNKPPPVTIEPPPG